MYCECGCGEIAPLAPQTNKRFGWLKDQPLRFLKGHNSRKRSAETRAKLSASSTGRKQSAESIAKTSKALKGRTKSDETKARMSAAQKQHGLTGTPTHNIWGTMIQRCTNPNSMAFKHYGARGITVCERWLTFENFLADMGERPSTDHSIDRYPDNAGNYEPNNCRWATATEQARNTKTNKILTHNGQSRCIAEWAELTGIKYETIRRRLHFGWTVEEALTRPVRGKSLSTS